MAIRRNTKSSPGFMIFFGLIWVIIALVMFYTSSVTKNMHERCTESTTGVVQSVSSERRTRKSGKHRRVTYYVYRTNYAFDADNKTVYGTSTLSASERLETGSTLAVKYNPSNPEKEHYTRYDENGKGGMIVSGFFGVIGLIVVISGISQKAKSGGSGFSRAAAGTGVLLNGMNNNSNYNYNTYNSNGYNNGYNNNSYNNGYNNNYNNGYNSNNYNNGYNNSYNNDYNSNNYNNGYNNSYNNDYNSNNYNNGYNNNYNNDYNNNNYNNGYNNNYNNGYDNNNVYSGGNDYNDFNQLN